MITQAISAVQSAVFYGNSVLITAVFVATVDDRVRAALRSFAELIACNKIKVGHVYFERMNLASQYNQWSNRTRMARTVEFTVTRLFGEEDLAPFINGIAEALEEIRALIPEELEVTA